MISHFKDVPNTKTDNWLAKAVASNDLLSMFVSGSWVALTSFILLGVVTWSLLYCDPLAHLDTNF